MDEQIDDLILLIVCLCAVLGSESNQGMPAVLAGREIGAAPSELPGCIVELRELPMGREA